MPLPMATSACISFPSGVGTRSRSVPRKACFKNSMNSDAPCSQVFAGAAFQVLA